jgi:hypothetical protein
MPVYGTEVVTAPCPLTRLAPVVRQERPRDQRPDDLPDGPPDREESEEVLLVPGQELEEHGPVHWEVAPGPETDAGDERAEADVVWGASRGDAEDAGDDEGGVPGEAAAACVSERSERASTSGEFERSERARETGERSERVRRARLSEWNGWGARKGR